MRDAFGSTFMFYIIIIFIVMYVTFATIAVSYARTFRLKNRILDIVEQSQLSTTDTNEIINKINSFDNAGRGDKGYSFNLGIPLRSAGYQYSNTSVWEKMEENCCNELHGVLVSEGVCISPIQMGTNTERYYYKVTLYIVIKVPVISYNALIPVSGDTEVFGLKQYHLTNG